MSGEPILSEISQRTALYDEHVALGARMVPFAGYDMPVQYPMGILNEHKWTRENAGLFDVSHMGQWDVTGPNVFAAFEKLVAADVRGLADSQQRYSQFLNPQGGILDDLMVTRRGYSLYVVVNAGCKATDLVHAHSALPAEIKISVRDDLALLALQGPKAEAVLAKHDASVREMKFMHSQALNIAGIAVAASRSGYTGEDGFELSVSTKDVVALWKILLADANVKPIGLGARDSLRLEAGLCLYGHDIDETTSPIEAGLQWSIPKQRRIDGGFIGAERVQRDLAQGVARKRVGIKPEGRAPARDGTEVQDLSGRKIGMITSGGFGPTVNGPVAMGYVEMASAVVGTKIQLIVRGQALPAVVCALPFVPNTFKR